MFQVKKIRVSRNMDCLPETNQFYKNCMMGLERTSEHSQVFSPLEKSRLVEQQILILEYNFISVSENEILYIRTLYTFIE